MEQNCVKHLWMKYHGLVGKSCRCCFCPVHGVRECRRRFHRKKLAFKDGWGFRTFIAHFRSTPSPEQVRAAVASVRKIVRKWDEKAVVGAVLHPLERTFHLHIGVQSRYLSADYVVPSRGRPKKYNWSWVKQELRGVTGLRVKLGKFDDQPERWLWYSLRCKDGWPENEQLPRGYKLSYGLRAPKRRVKVVLSQNGKGGSVVLSEGDLHLVLNKDDLPIVLKNEGLKDGILGYYPCEWRIRIRRRKAGVGWRLAGVLFPRPPPALWSKVWPLVPVGAL